MIIKHVIRVSFSVFGLEPSFDVPVINVTVHEGDIAVLPCSVEFLGEHKVISVSIWYLQYYITYLPTANCLGNFLTVNFILILFIGVTLSWNH
mgnify:CR=1 FL=1